MDQHDDTEPLSPPEAARVRRRDRRRRTRMVVDNAGVKRIQLALRARARRPAPEGERLTEPG